MCFFKKIILSIYTPYKHTNRISSNKVAIKILSTTFLSLMDEQSQNGESFREFFRLTLILPVGKNQLKKMGLLCTQLLGKLCMVNF